MVVSFQSLSNNSIDRISMCTGSDYNKNSVNLKILICAASNFCIICICHLS